MAGICEDDLDYEESREEKHAFDRLLGLLDDVNFRLPEHISDWDENQRRLAKQLERCSQYETESWEDSEKTDDENLKSVYERITEKIDETRDFTGSVQKMIDDVKRTISTRNTNISNLRSFANTAETFRAVGIGGRIAGAGMGIVGGACILAAPFTGGGSLALGGVICATSAAYSIATSLIEAFGSKAQIDKANKTFQEDKSATEALEEAIRQFTAKYEHFLKSLLTLRFLGDLPGLTMNIALVGMLAAYPVLTLIAREAIEGSLQQGGKLVMKQGQKVLSTQILEKTAKSVLKGVGNVVLGSVFIIIDLWELIRNVKEASEVGQIAQALRNQARELENGLNSLKDYKGRLQAQLASLQKHMRMMQQLAEASKEVLTASNHILAFQVLLCVLQQLDNLTESLEDDTDDSDSDSDDDEEERKYKVATLNVRSLGARSSNKPGFISKKIAAHNTDILFLTETWFQTNNHTAKKLLQDCCPQGYSYINHPFLNERPKCGVAIVFNAQKLNINGLQRHDYGDVTDGGITGIGATFVSTEPSLDLSFKATSLYCPPEHGSMRMKCKRLMYIFRMYCELGIRDLFYSIVDAMSKCKQPRRECIIGGDFNIPVNKRTNNLAVAFKSMNTAAGFSYSPHTSEAPDGTHRAGNILDLIVSREYVKRVFVDKAPERYSITDHFWVQGTVTVKGKSRPT